MNDARVRLHHDRTTWLLYAQYSVFGYFLYAFTPSVTLLRDNEHVTDAVAGLHGTCYAVGVIVLGLLAARILARLGRTTALWIFLFTLGAGIALYTAAPMIAITLPAAALAGAGGSGVVITVGAALADHHGPAGPAALTEANGVSAGVGVLAPLAVGASVALGYGWRPALWIANVMIVVLFLLRGRFAGRPADPARASVVDAHPSPADGLTVVEPTGAKPTGRVGPLGTQYWLSWSIVVLCVGIEFCMTLWCAQLLREHADLSAAVAATGVTAVVLGMCVGRFVGARIAARRDVDWMLIRAFGLTAVGFAVFWVSHNGVLSFVGLTLCGLGMALHYPLGLARAIRAAGGDGQAANAARSDVASSRVSAGTGVAIGLAPFVLGFLADNIGIAKAFLLVPVLLALATTALLVAVRLGRRASESIEMREPVIASR